jgi:hypothetical protein
MRVCIISDAWTPQVNGVVTTMKKMVAGLQAKGHEVLVIHPGLFKTLPCPTYPEIRLALKPQAKMIGLLNEFGPQAIHLTTEGPWVWPGAIIACAGGSISPHPSAPGFPSMWNCAPAYQHPGCSAFGAGFTRPHKGPWWPRIHSKMTWRASGSRIWPPGAGEWIWIFSASAPRIFCPGPVPSACTWAGWRWRKTWRPFCPWICRAPKW